MSVLEFLATLVHSLALSLSLTWAYSFIVPFIESYSARTQSILKGLMFGVFAILGIITATTNVGIFKIDGRNAMVALAGVFGGPLSAVVTALTVSMYRILVGGPSPLVAVILTLTTLGLSVIFYYRYRYLTERAKILRLLFLGVAIAIQSGFWIILLDWTNQPEFITVTFPGLLVYYPISTALLGTLLLYHQHNLKIRQDLERERFLLRTLIDQLPDYIFVKDAKLRFVASNIAHARAVNITNIDDMIGKSAPELFPEEMAENFESDDRQVLESGEPLVNAERVTTDATGNKRWVLTTKVPFRDPNGQIAGLVGISRDITSRRRVEEALRNSEEQFRTSFDYAAIGMALVRLDGRWLKVNRAQCNIVGYTPEEMLQKSFQDITHPDDLDADLNYVRQLVAGEIDTYHMEKRYFHKQGHVVWVLLSVSLVRDADGQPLHFISQIQNITRRKQAEAALIDERNLLRTLIDHMPDFVFIKDKMSRFMMANKAVLAANGLTANEQILGKTDQDLLPANIAQSYNDDDRVVFETGQTITNKEEMSIDLQTGQNHWLLTTKVPLRDKDGLITSLLGISRNITDRKKAQQQATELILQKEKVLVLADFMRDASHDLKTPLTVIQSSLYLLQRSPDPERKKQHAALIEQQVTRLAQLIDDQLLMIRLDSSTEFRFESVNLNLVAHEVMTSISPLAERQKLTLVEYLDKNVPRVSADEEKLMRALHNLVENAVNYTFEGGSVAIRTYTKDSQGIFEVRDTGIGIAENDLPRIFERFFRADKARSTQTGGSGLGLPIAQKIIEAHGGRIEVESVVGTGSAFRVCLPLSENKSPLPH